MYEIEEQWNLRRAESDISLRKQFSKSNLIRPLKRVETVFAFKDKQAHLQYVTRKLRDLAIGNE